MIVAAHRALQRRVARLPIMSDWAAPAPAHRTETGRYRGARIAVGTRHGKGRQLGPAFRRVLGARLFTPRDLDTDRFGTFTGEFARQSSALDAARGKARLAMAVSGLKLAVASEASYGPLAGSGLMGHEEILLFCDAESDLEVLEGYRSAAVPGPAQTVATAEEVAPSVLAGLSRQAVVVRPHQPTTTSAITKGITDPDALRGAIVTATELSADGTAVVEPDLRAHHNPSRRRVLARLALSLAHRIATECPNCGIPGFGRVQTEPGLRCRQCGTPTPLSAAEIHGCTACPARVSRPVATPRADPRHCPRCNP